MENILGIQSSTDFKIKPYRCNKNKVTGYSRIFVQYLRICLKALKKNFSGFVRSEVLKLRKVKKNKANKEKQKIFGQMTLCDL